MGIDRGSRRFHARGYPMMTPAPWPMREERGMMNLVMTNSTSAPRFTGKPMRAKGDRRKVTIPAFEKLKEAADVMDFLRKNKLNPSKVPVEAVQTTRPPQVLLIDRRLFAEFGACVSNKGDIGYQFDAKTGLQF